MVKSYTLARRSIQREQTESKDVSELSQSSTLESKEEEEEEVHTPYIEHSHFESQHLSVL